MMQPMWLIRRGPKTILVLAKSIRLTIMLSPLFSTSIVISSGSPAVFFDVTMDAGDNDIIPDSEANA